MKITKLGDITPDFDAAIRPLLGLSFNRIADEIIDGSVEAWEITHRGGDISYLVNRFIADELLIIAYSGKSLRDVACIIVDSATKNGCMSITFHTKRRGLNRLLHDFGFDCVGQFYTYEKVLKNGQG